MPVKYIATVYILATTIATHARAPCFICNTYLHNGLCPNCGLEKIRDE